MSESLMKSARELKAYLAQRTILNPQSEFAFLTELLESPELAKMSGRTKLDMLEILWPSIIGLLDVLERQMNGSWQKQQYAENSLFLNFENLAKHTQNAYIEAAMSMHHQFKPWWGEYPRATALTRAIHLSAHIAHMRLSLYIPLENGYWQRLYTLWQEIEHAKLMNQDTSFQTGSPLSSKISEILIGIAIMSTLSTNALPSQEIKPLLACFVQFSSVSQIHKKQPPEDTQWISFDFNHDTPPKRHNPAQQDNGLQPNQDSRFISLEPLTELMRTKLEEFSGDFIYITECAVLVSRATLEQVTTQLEHTQKPRRERPKASGQCYVYSGMDVIGHLLQEDAQLGQFAPAQASLSPRLIQEGIDTPPEATNLIEDKAADIPPDQLWDMVGRGHLIYEAPSQNLSNPEFIHEIHHNNKLWDIVDLSMDGLRLQSTRSKDDPLLSIGSIVLVEFPRDMSIDYIIGILRWELNPSATRHEIGIETLAHQAKTLRISGSHQNTSVWYEALLLPPSRRSEDPWILVPNQEYRTGTSVMALTPRKDSANNFINPHEPMRELILGRKILQTASIGVFQFQYAQDMAEFEYHSDDTLGSST